MKLAKTQLLFCIGLLYVSGCSLLPTTLVKKANVYEAVDRQPPTNVTVADLMIAEDFVNIIVQIDALSPWTTMLQFDGAHANVLTYSFGKALREAAKKRGYSIQTGDHVSGAQRVSFAIDKNGDDVTYTYNVSVGEIDFRREYRPLAGGGVAPEKAMLVRGTNAIDLESDDSIFQLSTSFNVAGPNESDIKPTVQLPEAKTLGPANSVFDSPVARKAEQRRQPYKAMATLDAPLAVQQDGKPLAQTNNATDYQVVRKNNIALSGESNYENLLGDKQSVAEETLIFDDDSYILGAQNKKILADMMGSFNPETDVISVVGCSTGVTKIENGNAALAIGRANRVKEALLYSGIAHDKIYDEGCWSPTPNSTPFPNRGVVITVKRNVKNG